MLILVKKFGCGIIKFQNRSLKGAVMEKILLAGQNKYWGTLEQATEFWLSLGIKHVMIKLTKDTKYIENDGEVIEKQFERFQRLQEKYGVKYHLHPYAMRAEKKLFDFSMNECHSVLKKIFTDLDKNIRQHGLYPLITAHLPVFEKPDYNLKVDKRIALENGKSFFQNLDLKSKLALEVMHGPFKNRLEGGTALLGYKAKHFREIIGSKNYGLCIDVGHLNLAEEPLEKFLELTYPIYSAHLHGNGGTWDSHHMATKDNVKNSEVVKKMLKKVQGPVVLEVQNYDYSKKDFDQFFELWELR